MTTTMHPNRRLVAAAALVLTQLVASSAVSAAESGHEIHIARQPWTFAGFTGHYDQAQLQRGFQVYKEVCANCHGLHRIAFRNLVQKGGPGFPEESVKALAATYKVQDGPNDDGKMFMRPAKLSDQIPSPYANEKEARASQNGAYPPDLSNIIKARSIENTAPWYLHIVNMARDMAAGYQEGGADYLYALMTGYKEEAPKGVKLADGMQYNVAFAGNQIAMPPPLTDGVVTYQDGSPQTVAQYAKDVTAFLAWASDPSLDQRKSMGWVVLLYLVITSVLLYLAKKRIWADAH
jgi:cytochrome c1